MMLIFRKTRPEQPAAHCSTSSWLKLQPHPLLQEATITGNLIEVHPPPSQLPQTWGIRPYLILPTRVAVRSWWWNPFPTPERKVSYNFSKIPTVQFSNCYPTGSSVASNFTSSSLTKSYNMKHTKKKMTRKTSPFEKLTDEIIVKIFSKLSSDELCASCPQVCRRWYSIIWGSPDLWTQITFSDNPVVHVDMGLKSIFKLLSRDACSRQVPSFSSADDSLYLNYFSLKRASSGTSPFGYDSIPVQTFRITSVNNSESLTDRGLMLVARKCSNLKTLQLKSCPHVSNLGLSEILAKCWKIRKLDVTGMRNFDNSSHADNDYATFEKFLVTNCICIKGVPTSPWIHRINQWRIIRSLGISTSATVSR